MGHVLTSVACAKAPKCEHDPVNRAKLWEFLF
jgi:hypothetical protein